MRLRRIAALAVVLVAAAASPAWAMPPGPEVFCETYPESAHCEGGNPPCSLCHTDPPLWNSYGILVATELIPEAERPLSYDEFADALPAAMRAIESEDIDDDGDTNLEEIVLGTFPGNSDSVLSEPECPPAGMNTDYDVCNYDPRYVLRKVYLDFCGHSPDYEDVVELQQMSGSQQVDRIHQALDECLDSEFWLGKDGQVWQLAHKKIRPVGSIKAGEDQTTDFGFSDYYDDYNMFVFCHIDDRDVREVLTADYYVTRATGPTTYTPTDELIGFQLMQQDKRVGMLTTQWRMIYDVMFTPLPRTLAAQAYRGFLGFRIERLEGLYPVEEVPADYSWQGVDDPTCAICHSTLDPLMYPFINYNGLALQPGVPRYQYVENRLALNFPNDPSDLHDTPEAGHVLGKPVDDLRQWGQVAADSDEFSAATVRDYWELLMGQPVVPSDIEYHLLWRSLMAEHEYSVERMLHDLIDTEAYGAP
jgi:hypothetical protein